MISATKRPRRPCARPGCREWATDASSYCPLHFAEWQERRQKEREEQRQSYLRQCDKRRESPAKRGYNSAWNTARKGYLIQNPICVMCGRPATEVDHIIPHKGDYKLFWDVTNWQSLCHECHSQKTYSEVQAARKQKRIHKNGYQDCDGMQIFYIN